MALLRALPSWVLGAPFSGFWAFRQHLGFLLGIRPSLFKSTQGHFIVRAEPQCRNPFSFARVSIVHWHSHRAYTYVMQQQQQQQGATTIRHR